MITGAEFAKKLEIDSLSRNGDCFMDQELIAAAFNAAVASLTAERDAAVKERDERRAERKANREEVMKFWTERDEARAQLAAANERAEKAESDAVGLMRVFEGELNGDEAYLNTIAKAANEVGRALLVERDRLREENVALKAQIEDVDHECKRQLETDRYKSALGRAHAALQSIRNQYRVYSTTDQRRVAGVLKHAWCCTGCGLYSFVETPIHKEDCKILIADVVLADPDGKATGKYVAALENEHESGVELLREEMRNCEHDDRDGNAPICPHCYVDLEEKQKAYVDAHAAVEALRVKGDE